MPRPTTRFTGSIRGGSKSARSAKTTCCRANSNNCGRGRRSTRRASSTIARWRRCGSPSTSPAVPDFAADTTLAVTQALRNLSSVRALDLQDATARQSVSQARFNGLPGATLNASYGYNATGSAMNDVYRDLQQAQQFSLNLQV